MVRLGAEDGEHCGLLPWLCQNAVDADGRLIGELVRVPGFALVYGVTGKQTHSMTD